MKKIFIFNLIVFLVVIANTQAMNIPTAERIPSLENENLPVALNTDFAIFITVTNGKRDEYRAFKVNTLKMEVVETDIQTAANNHPFTVNFNYSTPLSPRFTEQPFVLINGWEVKYRYESCITENFLCSKLIITLSDKNKLTSERVISGQFDSRKKLADPIWYEPTLIFKSHIDNLVDGVLAINTDKNEVIKYFSNNNDGVFSGTFVSLISWGISSNEMQLENKTISRLNDFIGVGNSTGFYFFNRQMEEVISCYFIKDQNEKLKTLKCNEAKFTNINKKEQSKLLEELLKKRESAKTSLLK